MTAIKLLKETGILVLLCFVMMLVWALLPADAAESNIRLVIDGERIHASPPPVIKNGRTLVPVRLVSETLGARVDWYANTRSIVITKNNRVIKLKVDNRLVECTEGKTFYIFSDVPPRIFGSRTFVPLRLVSNALGVSVGWEGSSRTVYVHTDVSSTVSPSKIIFKFPEPGRVITGTTELQVDFNASLSATPAEIRYILLNPETGKGPIIARGREVNGRYRWLPDPLYEGSRLLAAVLYDKNGQFIDGKAIPVYVSIKPEVSITGINDGQTIGGTVSLAANLNFVATYVNYEVTNKNTGEVFTFGPADPEGIYKWTPEYEDNGNYTIRAVAYDILGRSYNSNPVDVEVNVERRLALKGVSANTTIDRPVTLWVSRNFLISKVEYLLKNVQSGEEKILLPDEGATSYRWFPSPELSGNWEIQARVTDTKGNVYYTGTISVQVPNEPQLLLQTVGPGQIISGEIKLKSIANVPLRRIEYRLINPKTGKGKVISGGREPSKEYSWTPQKKDAGNWNIKAVAITNAGKKLVSETIPVRIYLGSIYDSKPLMDKDKFLNYSKGLARSSYEKTGMSAALQTAQAILETGWGQYVPVDKYTGQISNNLFGIKGSGSAGSVISNTWEEYNGRTYRIDAKFRAYQDPAESWSDHKEFLLNGKRYAPFRNVMHNSTRGAWALRRCGYATDSRYALKLIDIIKRYDLHLLDEVAP